MNDELHVLITVEDSENRAQMKLQRAIDEVKKLLVVVSFFKIESKIESKILEFSTFQTEGEDELKKRQLMELAIMNGTYRDSQSKNSSRKSSTLQMCIAHNLLKMFTFRPTPASSIFPLDTLLSSKLQYPSLFDEFLSQRLCFSQVLL